MLLIFFSFRIVPHFLVLQNLNYFYCSMHVFQKRVEKTSEQIRDDNVVETFI